VIESGNFYPFSNTDNGKQKTEDKLSDTIKYAPRTIRNCSDFAEAFEMTLSIMLEIYCIDNIDFY
jgi:hypothetical protein